MTQVQKVVFLLGLLVKNLNSEIICAPWPAHILKLYVEGTSHLTHRGKFPKLQERSTRVANFNVQRTWLWSPVLTPNPAI